MTFTPQPTQSAPNTPESGSEPKFLEPLAECLGRHAHAASVFGEPVVHGDVTIIPVARAAWGLGGGTGRRIQDNESGSGGGGGMMVRPVGFIEIAGRTAKFRPIRDPLLVAPMLLGAGSLLVLALRAWTSRRDSGSRK